MNKRQRKKIEKRYPKSQSALFAVPIKLGDGWLHEALEAHEHTNKCFRQWGVIIKDSIADASANDDIVAIVKKSIAEVAQALHIPVGYLMPQKGEPIEQAPTSKE